MKQQFSFTHYETVSVKVCENKCDNTDIETCALSYIAIKVSVIVLGRYRLGTGSHSVMCWVEALGTVL